jgi:hypothetical protein
MLRWLDRELRTVIKDILHLPQSTANDLLYFSKKDGGLAIAKFEVLIISSSLSTGYRFLRSQDPIIQALSAETGLEKRLQALCRSARINLPVKLRQDITAFKKKGKINENYRTGHRSTHRENQ